MSDSDWTPMTVVGKKYGPLGSIVVAATISLILTWIALTKGADYGITAMSPLEIVIGIGLFLTFFVGLIAKMANYG